MQGTFEINKPLVDPRLLSLLGNSGILDMSNPKATAEHPPWPDGWELVSGNGKLLTRIVNYAFKEKGIKLKEEFKEMLGNMIARSVYPPMILDIDTTVTPEKGKYGDNNSCYYTTRRNVWPLLRRVNGAIIKMRPVTEEVDSNRYKGRALMLPDSHPHQWWLFNAYQVPLEIAAVAFGTVADTLWPELNLQGSVRTFTVNHDDSWPFFINKTKGVLIGLPNADTGVKSIRTNLNLDVDSDQIYCNICNCEIYPPGRMFEVSPDWDWVTPICEPCKDIGFELIAKATPEESYWYTNLYFMSIRRPDEWI